jgi:hypothetical protein
MLGAIMTDLYTLKQDISQDHLQTKSWKKTGDKFGLNKATARLIANGKRPGKRIKEILHIERKPQVKHICENCGAWAKNVNGDRGYEFYQCRIAYDSQRVEDDLHTKPNFGCVLWYRKDNK